MSSPDKQCTIIQLCQENSPAKTEQNENLVRIVSASLPVCLYACLFYESLGMYCLPVCMYCLPACVFTCTSASFWVSPLRMFVLPACLPVIRWKAVRAGVERTRIGFKLPRAGGVGLQGPLSADVRHHEFVARRCKPHTHTLSPSRSLVPLTISLLNSDYCDRWTVTLSCMTRACLCVTTVCGVRSLNNDIVLVWKMIFFLVGTVTFFLYSQYEQAIFALCKRFLFYWGAVSVCFLCTYEYKRCFVSCDSCTVLNSNLCFSISCEGLNGPFSFCPCSFRYNTCSFGNYFSFLYACRCVLSACTKISDGDCSLFTTNWYCILCNSYAHGDGGRHGEACLHARAHSKMFDRR